MPRIRKKTSNRGSTNERKKILHKVRESRRKKAKAAKKSPQWKSKQPKDPGIPNNFPYKDQILAEVAEERRRDAEEKQRRKDAKKASKSAPNVEADVEGGSDEETPSKGNKLDVGLEGIASLSAKTLKHSKATARAIPVVVEEQEDEVPILINRDLPNFQAVFDDVDAVIQVLDARDPLSFRNTHLEELVSSSGKKLLFVLNKIDLCPQESVAAWISFLRTSFPTIPFRSASRFLPSGPETVAPKAKGKSKREPAGDGQGVQLAMAYLSEWAKSKPKGTSFSVAILGVTNAGKSSFVNSIIKKSALPIYTAAASTHGPSTTTYPQEVHLEVEGHSIRLIDTPGLLWEAVDVENQDQLRARDILTRNRGRVDRLKDPKLAVAELVSRANTEDLMVFYSLPAFSKQDPVSFLSGVARSQQLVKKRGELDLVGACRIVLRDWNVNRFPHYTHPLTQLPASQTSGELLLASVVESEKRIVGSLPTRKDLRKLRGLIKLTPGMIDTRKIALTLPWTSGGDDENEEPSTEDEENTPKIANVQHAFASEDEDEQDEDDDGLDEDSEAEDEVNAAEPANDSDEETDDHSSRPIATLKRKRTGPLPKTVLKKVTFAVEPKSSRPLGKTKGVKQSRKVVASQKLPVTGGTKSAKAPIQKMKSTTPKQGDESYDFSKFF